MEAIAKLNNDPTSPRKMRLVADLIRGERVSHALNVLKFNDRAGSAKMEKLLISAIDNWQAKNPEEKLEDADLYVKTITVDSARMLKRIQTAPQGRAHRIRKRSNHITLVVDSLTASTTETETKEKEESTEETEK